ncbi:DUF2510 domain-containing protein [Pseudactinotalea sp. Z1748]|uniref:DUF2510 domain-containing protein n=1 Tax=Pseudactinotalea sp. Z1748 TaxID=3413027 RepID=UPI003C7D8875
MSEKEAGWYPDPSGENQQRFWDGDGWTEYFQPLLPQPEAAHDSRPPTEDYPYLAQAGGTMTTPHIPPPQGWATSTNTWSAPQPTTSWGTPADPQDYAGGDYRPPDPAWDAGAGTQVYRSGTQGGGGGRGGLIAVVVASVVVLVLLVVGGVLAFRGNDGGGAGDDGPAEEGVVEVGATSSGSVPRDGQWVGALAIADAGAYLVDARSTSGDDLQMAVRDGGGATLAYNDDRGNLLQLGGDRLDPIAPVYLDPGEYEVVLSEYRGRATDVTVDVVAITERLTVGDVVQADIEADGAFLAVLELEEETELTVDVQAVGAGDPTLTVRSLDRDAMWTDDDRGSRADDEGGSTYDPLLTEDLQAGRYAVMVAEYGGDPLTVQIELSSS